MSHTLRIKCKKCGDVFSPDMITKGPWICPSCQTKHPNLKRHYRSVGDWCILGVLGAAIAIAMGVSADGLKPHVFLTAGHAVLLLITIALVYRSEAPWTDGAVKALIWTVFGLTLVVHVALPLVLAGTLFLPVILVLTIVLLYLVWLHLQTGKCAAPDRPSPAPEKE